MKIAIVSGSARPARQSHYVALEIMKRLEQLDEVELMLLDPRERPLPVLEYIYARHPSPTPAMIWWKEKIDAADAYLWVTPEHNSSFSGAIKNALDYFYEEYAGKPMGIVAVSSGAMGGINAVHALQPVCLRIGGILMPNFMITPKVKTLFDETGRLTDEAYAQRLEKFLHQFVEFSKKHSK